MYVIYPADELLRIYENRNRDPSQVLTGDHHSQSTDQVTRVLAENQRNNEHQSAGQQECNSKKGKSKKERRRERGGQTIRRRRRTNEIAWGQASNEVAKGTRRDILTRTMLNSRAAAGEDAANPLRELTQPGLNEPLKQHNAAALKLVQTVSEFAQELGAVMETHSTNVRRLVDEFRTRSADTRVDTGGMRRVWESMLRQVQADAEAHLDLAAVLQQQLSRPTLEASFHRKLQSKKVFARREAYEQVVAETEKKLQRARADYKRAYAALLTIDDGSEQELKRVYFEAHNAYVLQLRATNAITERYQSYCLPNLLSEIAEVYEELCGLACKCVAGVSEAAAERAGEQTKRYQAVVKEAQVIAPLNDLQILARTLGASATLSKKPAKRLFVAPAPPERVSTERINQIPPLRDELAPVGTSSLPMMENLRREHDNLTQEITRLQDALDALIRMQRKSAESNLYTKVAELQEDISMKRFELGEAQLYLAAVQAQIELNWNHRGGRSEDDIKKSAMPRGWEIQSPLSSCEQWKAGETKFSCFTASFSGHSFSKRKEDELRRGGGEVREGRRGERSETRQLESQKDVNPPGENSSKHDKERVRDSWNARFSELECFDTHLSILEPRRNRGQMFRGAPPAQNGEDRLEKELFGAGEAGQPDGVSSRKMSNGSTGSTKHKWLKAFKSLKTSSPTTPPSVDKGKQTMYHAVSTVVDISRKSLESEGGHCWREHTYRKITPCDACGQVLRGHSRQGVRCRSCKANAHTDCINMVQPAMCPKKGGGIPLLRRQKTQTQVDETPATEHNVDAIYQVLKQAGEIRGNSTNSPPTPPTADHPPAPSSARASSHPCPSSTSGRGSGGSMSGTRPFGQPLVLMAQGTPSTSSAKTPEPPHRGANRKR
ncbi:SH3 and cysteine-rich domain-containing protein 2 [Habropoda laboriosa]|uniref:SH3 and cysteine-rich domain-containing protein 2 n=1 Tax=Habropoda laboriosa TaxID=597456 RepID=A0A0L7RAN2_9HYME|nr:SH3 and cysteine-rich domain-containing protein 2 [Habropoda laboriosa]